MTREDQCRMEQLERLLETGDITRQEDFELQILQLLWWDEEDEQHQ